MFANHPRGLFPLFFTEMWERFGFYIMIALLALYMEAPTYEGGLGFPKWVSAQIYGLYMGFLYFTPLFGGLLADRAWGFIRAITLGGLAMMCGNLFLTAPGLAFFFIGLVCIIIGNGLFKPNISTMLGNLYRDKPQLKDAGFNLFYMGINMGAFAAPLVATWLKNSFVEQVSEPLAENGVATRYGWPYAFAAAAGGMLVSVVLFRACRRWIIAAEHARFVARPEAADPENGTSNMTGKRQSGTAEPAAALTDAERVRIQALFIIFGIVILFWMAFSQNGMTLLRWARDSTAPLGAIDFQQNAALTKAINPGLVILLTPLLVLFWTALKNRGLEVSTPRKMMFGMLLTASCFLVMGLGGLMGADEDGVRVSILWLFSGYFLVTLGELCVSPMGLSVVSKLAPARHGGLLMGGWFVATAVGNYLAGAVASVADILELKRSTFFFFLVCSSLLAACVLWRVLRRLEHAISLVTAPAPVPSVNGPVAPAAEPARTGS